MTKDMGWVRRSLESMIKITNSEYHKLCKGAAQFGLPKGHPVIQRIAIILAIHDQFVETSLFLNDEFETGLYRGQKGPGRRRKRGARSPSRPSVQGAFPVPSIAEQLAAIVRDASKDKG